MLETNKLVSMSKRNNNKPKRKGIAIRINAEKIDLFRKLCKENDLSQTSFFENAIDLAIEELTKKDK